MDDLIYGRGGGGEGGNISFFILLLFFLLWEIRASEEGWMEKNALLRARYDGEYEIFLISLCCTYGKTRLIEQTPFPPPPPFLPPSITFPNDGD